MTRICLAIVLALSASLVAADVQAPTLSTDAQKDLTIAFQAVELWQLRATNALAEFEKARTAAQGLARKLTPAGYQINQTPAGAFELLKVPEPKP